MSPHRLHRRILIVLAAVGAVIVTLGVLADKGPGLDRLGLVIGAVVFAGSWLLHAAVSSILVTRAQTWRGVVLAHLAAPLLIAAYLALRRG